MHKGLWLVIFSVVTAVPFTSYPIAIFQNKLLDLNGPDVAISSNNTVQLKEQFLDM